MTPLAVWDAKDRLPPTRVEAKAAWLRKHGIDPDILYRVEFYQPPGEAPFARLFAYHLNGEGRRHLDRPGGEPVVEEPRDVLISELPRWTGD